MLAKTYVINWTNGVGILAMMNLIYRCSGMQGWRPILNVMDLQMQWYARMEINFNDALNEVDDLSVLLSLIVVLKHLSCEYLRLRQAPNLLQNFVLRNQLLSLTRLVCFMFVNFK